MQITIMGGGNIGTLMAAELAHKGHTVTLYTSKPEKFAQELEVLAESGEKLFTGKLAHVTDHMQQAMDAAEVIFVTVPAMAFSKMASAMLPYARRGQYIGVVPGSGGAEFAFAPLLEKGCVLFGLQRVHSIARLNEYGRSVYMLGRKSGLALGAIPAEKARQIAAWVSEMFAMPCEALPNYLSVTLTPSNPILHTSRLYSMFKEATPDTRYTRNFLFYEEWDNASSQVMLRCDAELQQLCQVIPLDLSGVKSLKEHYESETPQAMTEKISHIEAFKGLLSPMKETENGFAIDLGSRYFTADFSYGLKIIRDMAETFAVPTPQIQTLWDWYRRLAPDDARGAFRLAMPAEALVALYAG